MFIAHLFGRSKRGDREEVLLKLFDPTSGEPINISGSGGSVGVVNWTEAGWEDRPDSDIALWYAPEDGDYSDPTELMENGDQLIAPSVPTP